MKIRHYITSLYIFLTVGDRIVVDLFFCLFFFPQKNSFASTVASLLMNIWKVEMRKSRLY